MKEPQTPEEWQTAVDCAHGALALDSARKYGLVTGGPKVEVQRCCEILERGKVRGVKPTPDAIKTFMGALLAEEAERKTKAKPQRK